MIRPERGDHVRNWNDARVPKAAEAKEVLIFRDFEIGVRGCGTFQNAVIVGIFLDNVQGLGWHDTIRDGEQF